MLLSRILPITRGLLGTKQIIVKSPAFINGTWNFEQNRGYKNFGHKRTIEPTISICFLLFLTGGLFFFMIDWRWCRMLYLRYTGQLEEKPQDTSPTKWRDSIKSN